MKLYCKFKRLISVVVIMALFLSACPIIMVDATDGYANSTGSNNCYAYAINRVIESSVDGERFYNPQQDEKIYQPGDISKPGNFYSVNNIYSYERNLSELKCTVISDLYTLGYTGVMIYNNIEDEIAYNTMLANVVSSNKELICFRIGATDYHFMKYDPVTSAWYNKIGYGPIFEYTDNNGIPSNDVPWVGSSIYDSEIIYLAYNKLQINISETEEFDGIVTVKSGGNYIPSNNYIFCCGDEACCNPNGVCLCDSELMGGGKDAVYEIVIPESGYYNISTQLGGSLGFYCTIYSYNMYNGDYAILSTVTDSTGFNTGMFFQASENTENRYYLKVHFNKLNPYDMNISINVTHQHDYTNHYDDYSSTQHKCVCWCGVYELQNHSLGNGLCILCGAPHIHDYSDRYIPKTNSTHISYCGCGSTSIQPHVVSAGAFSSGNKYAICLACGGTATTGVVLHQAVWNLPRSENGSFILPDGVIVLVDEDVEAYFDGRLEFIYPDDNLETE